MKNRFWKMTGRVGGWVGLVLLTGWLNTGCQTAPNQFSSVPGDLFPTGAGGSNAVTSGAPSGTLGGEEAGRLAVEDLVKVTFSGVEPPIQPHEERIKEDGNITMPLVGAIKAEGRTPGELQKAITEAYVPKFYKRLTVTVTTDRRIYYVGGQVRMPGRQEYLGPTTVTKAIQSAGDFTDFAAKTRVELTRANGKFIKLDCEKAAKDPSQDLPVFPGDKIHVPQRDWRDILR
jgi:polysaccharide biosynthesis/export protein VpsN